MEQRDDGNTNCSWYTWISPQIPGKNMKVFQIRGRIETILTSALLRSARILRRVPETWRDLLTQTLGIHNIYIYVYIYVYVFVCVKIYMCVCVYIYIIIILSRRQRGYPWPSLAISPYHLSLPAGLQGYILCPHIVAVCKFVLVVLLLHIHMWGSTGVHRLWARPCFSSSVPRVWFIWLV